MGLFLIVIVIAVLLLVLMIVKFNVHPVLALFVSGMFAGVALGYGPVGSVSTFTKGFGGTLASIGCTIMFGSIIAEGIRDTGSAKSMVNFFIKLFRGKNLELSTGLAAYVMSIPVFGDIVKVLTAPIAAVISKRSGKPMSIMSAYTMLGASLTHSLVPPTPGILAVAILLGADLGMVILWGIVVTIVGLLATWISTKKWVEKDKVEPRPDYVEGIEPCREGASYKELLIKEPGLPNVIAGVSPILVPVILITADSFAKMYLPEGNALRVGVNVLGERNLSLFIGVLLTFLLGVCYKDNVIKTFNANKHKNETKIANILLNEWIKGALNVALIPLLVTAMGGGFSEIIKGYSGVEELGAIIAGANFPGLLVPFIIGMVMQTAVGSRTTAGMTAAGICAPMIASLGVSPVACTLLIGSGTMIGSHFSDSGFWTGISMFNLSTAQGLKYITLIGAIAGVFCFLATWILMLFGV